MTSSLSVFLGYSHSEYILKSFEQRCSSLKYSSPAYYSVYFLAV